jgi:hypothetical protein
MSTPPPFEAIYTITCAITEGDVGELSHFAQAALDDDGITNIYPAVVTVLRWLAEQPAYRDRATKDLAQHLAILESVRARVEQEME